MPADAELDIGNLAEEIEGLGRSAIADLSSAIGRVLTGLMKRSIDPDMISPLDIYSAQSEAIIRADAGVWRHVDLDHVWKLASRSVDAELPDRCPLTIEEILSEDFSVVKAVDALRS